MVIHHTKTIGIRLCSRKNRWEASVVTVFILEDWKSVYGSTSAVREHKIWHLIISGL